MLRLFEGLTQRADFDSYNKSTRNATPLFTVKSQTQRANQRWHSLPDSCPYQNTTNHNLYLLDETSTETKLTICVKVLHRVRHHKLHEERRREFRH